MMKREREILIEQLTNCDLVEFARIINLAISRRSDAQTESNLDRTRLLFGQAVQTRADDGPWSRWKIWVVASADMSAYGPEWEFGNGEPFLQEGECGSCQTKLCSHAKATICPICGCRNVLT
jgi:hypothetical protein